MYYTVGETRNGFYIWDTEDNSCQYTDKSKLAESGVVAPVMRFNEESPYKLAMLFGLKVWQKYLMYFNLVAYLIADEDITVQLSIVILDRGAIKIGIDNIQTYSKYGYFKDYVVLLCIDINSSQSEYKPVFDYGYFNYIYLSSVYRAQDFFNAFEIKCIEIPPCMIGYILRLCKGGDLKGVHEALGNLIFDKIKWSRLSDYYETYFGYDKIYQVLTWNKDLWKR